MKTSLLWLCALAFLTSPLLAQEYSIHAQSFVSDSISVSRANGRKGDVLTGGVAVVVPVYKKLFVRPVVGAGKSFAINPPKATPSVPVIQAGTLVGYHATKRFSPIVGFTETMDLEGRSVVSSDPGHLDGDSYSWSLGHLYALHLERKVLRHRRSTGLHVLTIPTQEATRRFTCVGLFYSARTANNIRGLNTHQ